MPETFRPAEVFHPSDTIAAESIARDWSIWDFADRIGALKPQVTVLAFQFYASLKDPKYRMSDSEVMDLVRVFGISAEFWRRTEALCRDNPDRISDSDEYDDWYQMAEFRRDMKEFVARMEAEDAAASPPDSA